MVEISLSAPRRVSLPEVSIDSANRSDALVELIGVGWPPRRASTTNRWTVLLPTSSTPNRTLLNLMGLTWDSVNGSHAFTTGGAGGPETVRRRYWARRRPAPRPTRARRAGSWPVGS